ncbi:MAG: aminotransferase class V-fold PLP-dependent enzyme [Spirochaetales bacterium]|nr:aminotransferase class V-fold PLP-dependent enzyme [Spirochaetales bacterium]
MKRIYLDNGATSFPKAPGLGRVMMEYIESGVINPNRTESSLSYKAFDVSFSLREKLSSLFNYPYPECIAFTRNVTEALNWLIKGLLKTGDHVIVSGSEHNAVMRPINQMGIKHSVIPSSSHGFNDYSTLPSLIRPETRAIIINAAGNVSGAVQNLEIPAEIAKKHNLLFFIDAAQASPYVKIDMEALNASAVAFTGHKALLGPQGIGGMIIRKELALAISPLTSGGTGSRSDSEEVPSLLPDRLNPGTENMPGIVGLEHSLSFIEENYSSLKETEEERTRELMEGLSKIKGIHLFGAGIDERRTNVVSIETEGIDEAEVSALLLERGGIETRVGLHCSPSSHRTLGTFPRGTLRFSPGPFTTKDEIIYTLNILREIMENA